jgi:threonine aldolase
MPTDVQLMAGVRASRGDSVMGEDDATTALEKRLAALSGKEAAIFVASGTMGNQLGLRATLQGPPHSMILDHRAHIHIYEAGGAAVMCQVTSHALAPSNGSHLTASDIEAALQVGTDIHFSPTRLIALENTMNGVVFPQDEILRISKLARSHDIPMHLDGARAWNVAAKVIEERGLDARNEVHLGQVLSELLDPFNSVSLCLSKGLGAPIGS